MKLVNRLLIALALATAGSFALAAPGHGDHDRHGQDHDRRGHDRGYDRHHDDRRGYDHRRHAWRDHDDWRHDDRRYGYDRGYHRHTDRRYYSRHGHWERGHRYYGPTYVVRDYGYYRLRPPPRGYHWVRADNDYLLVAIATGVILDIALQ
jgi:Ni/Co efflux regulator RcnB